MTMLPLILLLAVSSAASARPFTLVAATSTEEDPPFSGTTASPPDSPDNRTFSLLVSGSPFGYPPSTLFLPQKEIGSYTFPSPADTFLLNYHTVPERLTYQQLRQKKKGTLLPTLLSKKSIRISSSSKSPVVVLDGVQVTHPELFVSELLVVHGVYKPLNCSAPASTGKREKILTIVLSVTTGLGWLGFVGNFFDLYVSLRKAWDWIMRKYYGVPAVQDQHQGPRPATPTPNAYDHVMN